MIYNILPDFFHLPTVEMLVNFVDGKAHDIKIGAYDFLYGDHANPILRPIPAGFVIRFVLIHVEYDFFGRQRLKGDFR
jgi:hypothetical protein